MMALCVLALLPASLLVAASLSVSPIPSMTLAACPTSIDTGKCIKTKAYKFVANVTTPEACCAACADEHPRCIVWVLGKAGSDPEKLCRLKDTDVPSVVDDQCAYSGRYPVVPTGPPPPPLPTPPPSQAPRPHVVVILQDDMGHYETAFSGNTNNSDVTAHMSSLAAEGVILKRHYTHWHCSPTRRSFLTGRLPLHHSELLSTIDTDDIDLRWTTIGQKLKSVGYTNYWFGKGHTGYKSTAHLPLALGFDDFTGFLSGAQSYTAEDRWQRDMPLNDTTYSADLFGQLALAAVSAHDPATPMFMYLPWQQVHEPYTAPPGWEGDALRGMLNAADQYIGQLVSLLKDKGMYENTVIFYCSDNGGVDKGQNWPFRGEKHTNWEGGMRVAAFISGGFLPPDVRGTNNDIVFHIVDWYPTICNLAGVNGNDDPPVPPLPVDPSDPTKDIYGPYSFPPVDGRDIWDLIVHPTDKPIDSVHPTLWLSAEVMLSRGRYKLVVAQPDPSKMSAGTAECGWKQKDETWEEPTAAQCACGCAFKDRTTFVPCLFDVVADASERVDLSASQPSLVADLWKALNLSNLELYGMSHSPPNLLGNCNASCASLHYGGSRGPICGVPGC